VRVRVHVLVYINKLVYIKKCMCIYIYLYIYMCFCACVCVSCSVAAGYSAGANSIRRYHRDWHNILCDSDALCCRAGAAPLSLSPFTPPSVRVAVGGWVGGWEFDVVYICTQTYVRIRARAQA